MILDKFCAFLLSLLHHPKSLFHRGILSQICVLDSKSPFLSSSHWHPESVKTSLPPGPLPLFTITKSQIHIHIKKYFVVGRNRNYALQEVPVLPEEESHFVVACISFKTCVRREPKQKSSRFLQSKVRNVVNRDVITSNVCFFGLV